MIACSIRNKPSTAGTRLEFTWGSTDYTTAIRIDATQLAAYNNGNYYLQLAEFRVFNETGVN